RCRARSPIAEIPIHRSCLLRCDSFALLRKSRQSTDETDDGAILFLDEGVRSEAACSTAAADFQLLVERAVESLLLRRRGRERNAGRNVAGARLKVADRRRPRRLNHPGRARLGVV